MANEEHLEILKQGVEFWNAWRKQNWKIDPDLSGANLTEADLSGVNFDGVDLSYAKLTDAQLNAASFHRADLSNADLSLAGLSLADLRRVKLTKADLTATDLFLADLSFATLDGANFKDAILRSAIFRGADLSGANFVSAKLLETTFADNDLSLVKGLDTVRHLGPCTIGIDTIYKSGGKIPASFLRGCGVPESFLMQMLSLVGAEDGIQFYSCFISYSSKDEEFATRLHGKMRDVRLRVWFAPEDIRSGKKLHEQIETAIRVYDKLLIILSEASLESEWVMDELRKGFKAERESGKRKLFPVRLTDYGTLQRWVCRDSSSGKDLAEELRQYFIPDFSHWKAHDQFEIAFSRLHKDLRAS
jgi:hypothetical protein